MKKQLTAIFLALALCLSCLSVMATPPLVPYATLSVSERDASGNITLTLTVGGVEYQGVQASLYYNPEELLVTDEHLKNITVGEPIGDKNSLNLVQAELHEESNCIAITAIMNLSLMDDEIYTLSSMSKQMNVFSLTVPATTDKPDVGFALKESPYYDKGNPEGLVISCNGKSKDAQTEVLYADGTIGQTGELKQPEPKKSLEQLRAERISDTVILQYDNYAAVQNGALCYIDESNKSVMPFAQNGEIYVPYRFVAEGFGYTVGWEDESQTPLLLKNGETQKVEMLALKEGRSFISVTTAENLLELHATTVGNCLIFTKADNPWNAEGAIEQGILSDAMLIMSPAIRDMK